MHRVVSGGPLPRLDARLRWVGEWLLVGYTVMLVLVTFWRDGPARAPGPERASTCQSR